MSFNIDEMEDNILHAIAVAKEKHKVEADFSFINGLPTNEEEYNKNNRWLNGEDKDGNQLYHADQKLTWKQVQDVVAEASARNKLYDLRKERTRKLAETDWYVVRKADAGTAVPSSITNHRAAVRTKAAEMETAITNASDTPALETLYKYTEQEDGSITRPLGELPTLES